VCFSHVGTRRRFYVAFVLDGTYPAAPLAHTFTPSVGSVAAADVARALDTARTAAAAAPYRQLTLMCAALDALVAA